MTEFMNTRRSFLKGAALGAAGVLSAGAAVTEAAAAPAKAAQYDCIVVGAG